MLWKAFSWFPSCTPAQDTITAIILGPEGRTTQVERCAVLLYDWDDTTWGRQRRVFCERPANLFNSVFWKFPWRDIFTFKQHLSVHSLPWVEGLFTMSNLQDYDDNHSQGTTGTR